MISVKSKDSMSYHLAFGRNSRKNDEHRPFCEAQTTAYRLVALHSIPQDPRLCKWAGALYFYHYFLGTTRIYAKSRPIVWTMKAIIQAMTHWKMTTQMAHCVPSSLFTDVMAATQGV